MSIWKASSVEDTPAIDIGPWSIFELESQLWEGKSRHIVGYNMTEREGRVSSQIVSFDKDKKIATTESGRHYRLVGNESGVSSDGSYVFNAWCRRNDAFNLKNVSEEYE
jgi:hypothetical protein